MQVRLLLLFASLLTKSFKTFLYRKRYSFEIRELILLKSKENELKELGANSLYFRGELTRVVGGNLQCGETSIDHLFIRR